MKSFAAFLTEFNEHQPIPVLYRGEGGLNAPYTGKQWGATSTYATTDLMIASIYGRKGGVHRVQLAPDTTLITIGSPLGTTIVTAADPATTARAEGIDAVINRDGRWRFEVSPHEVIIFNRAKVLGAAPLTPAESADVSRYQSHLTEAAHITRSDFERAMWKIVDAKQYRYYGLRTDGRDFPIGQVAPLSKDWSDKDWPTQLGGTSAIDVKDWEQLINYATHNLILLGSNDVWPGTDTSEIVMKNAVVLAVWHERDLLQPFWMSLP